MKKQEFQIQVPETDFVIKSNTIYTILPKPDPNAPDGFKEHGTTKVIHPDIGDVVCAPFDGSMGVWDTGFFDLSPCLRGMNEEEKEKFLKNVQANIVDPVERIKGEGVLDHQASNNFYDDFVINLANKISFNTSEPLQLLGLYLAILGKDLCPKEHIGHPAFKKAAFQVVNREKEISNKEQFSLDKTKAIGEFYKLISSDKDKAALLLKYLDISSTLITDEDVFMKVFNRYLEDKEDGYRNSKLFLESLDKFSTKEGEEELFIFEALNKLYDMRILKAFKGEFFLKEISLGNSIKHAAMFSVSNPDAKKLILSLLDQDEEEE